MGDPCLIEWDAWECLRQYDTGTATVRRWGIVIPAVFVASEGQEFNNVSGWIAGRQSSALFCLHRWLMRCISATTCQPTWSRNAIRSPVNQMRTTSDVAFLRFWKSNDSNGQGFDSICCVWAERGSAPESR